MVWNDLARESDVVPFSSGDEAVLREIQEVLERHGAAERFGVNLLHSHFDLGESELLLERIDLPGRSIVARPEASENVRDADLVATHWRLDDGEIRPLSYWHRYPSGDHAL